MARPPFEGAKPAVEPVDERRSEQGAGRTGRPAPRRRATTSGAPGPVRIGALRLVLGHRGYTAPNRARCGLRRLGDATGTRVPAGRHRPDEHGDGDGADALVHHAEETEHPDRGALAGHGGDRRPRRPGPRPEAADTHGAHAPGGDGDDGLGRQQDDGHPHDRGAGADQQDDRPELNGGGGDAEAGARPIMPTPGAPPCSRCTRRRAATRRVDAKGSDDGGALAGMTGASPRSGRWPLPTGRAAPRGRRPSG
jgi:hypothetical protein